MTNNLKVGDVVVIEKGHYKNRLGYVYFMMDKQPIVQVDYGIKDYDSHTQEFELNIVDLPTTSLTKIGEL